MEHQSTIKLTIYCNKMNKHKMNYANQITSNMGYYILYDYFAYAPVKDKIDIKENKVVLILKQISEEAVTTNKVNSIFLNMNQV